MLIPARQFSVSTDLNLQPIDNSANFLQQCIGPGFQLMWVQILRNVTVGWKGLIL